MSYPSHAKQENLYVVYDEQAKHVRTKKEILDENGNVRKGCKIVKKGEVYERNLFSAKNKLFKQENFVDEVKCQTLIAEQKFDGVKGTEAVLQYATRNK